MRHFTSSSSNVAHVAFDTIDPDDSPVHSPTVLDVRFRSGRSYRYFGVPEEVYDKLAAVEEEGGSCGQLFNQIVRGGGYEFEEV